MRFNELKRRWNWRPIRNCPGRFVLCREQNEGVPGFDDMIKDHADGKEYCTAHARDTVLVIELEDGGLISYGRPDGSYVHTLNTPEGFLHKLKQLEIYDAASQPAR